MSEPKHARRTIRWTLRAVRLAQRIFKRMAGYGSISSTYRNDIASIEWHLREAEKDLAGLDAMSRDGHYWQ